MTDTEYHSYIDLLNSRRNQFFMPFALLLLWGTQMAHAIERWRSLYREAHGREPGPPLLQDFVYCHEDPEEAERVAREHLSRYFLSVIKHYDFAGSHWRETKGYEAYQANYAAVGRPPSRGQPGTPPA